MVDVWERWTRVHRLLSRQRRFLLLLDFDGTLSPLVARPGEARLAPGLRSLLRRLVRPPSVSVAVMSGRPVRFLEKRLALKRLYLGGNHGLELKGPGFSFTHPGALRARPALRAVRARARRLLAGVPGAHLEDKRLSISLHYRNVPAAFRIRFHQGVRRLRRESAVWPLAWRRGHRVWEILPRIDWDKGRASAFLRGRLGRPFPIAIGDDETDEHMFQRLRDGMTIRIGPRESSGARFFLRRQGDVEYFLRALARIVSGRTNGFAQKNGTGKDRGPWPRTLSVRRAGLS